VILPFTDRDPAITLCERLKQKVQLLDFRYGNQTIKISISVGVSSSKDFDIEELIVNADTGLYADKRRAKTDSDVK
jgi:diguanylate cyclase (GGDEF)-like protein